MADWMAGHDLHEPLYENGRSNPSSAHSSVSSGRSQRPGLPLPGTNGQSADRPGTEEISSLRLDGGDLLAEESSLDGTYVNLKVEEKPAIPSRQPLGPAQKKVMKSMASSSLSANIESISEEDVEIPSDGCLFPFTVDQMANFFRCLKIPDHAVKHMHRKGVDGKRFSKFKDTDLETLGIKNPVVVYFRDRSKKKRLPFML